MLSKVFAAIALVSMLAVIGLCPAVSPDPEQGPNSGTRVQGSFKWTKMFGDTDELRNVLVADVDPGNLGPEVYVVGNSEWVTQLTGSHQTWTPKSIYQDDWFIESIAAGDIDPTKPGDELVITGKSQFVTMIYQTEDGWQGHVLFDVDDWTYDIAVADAYPLHAGNEVFFAGEGNTFRDDNGTLVKYYQLSMVYYDSGNWVQKNVYEDTYALNNVLCADLDVRYPGPEIYCSGLSNRIIEVYFDNGSWNRDYLFNAKSITTIESGDILPQNPGKELLFTSGTDLYAGYQTSTTNLTSGNVTYSWAFKKMFSDSKYITGIGVGDLMPTSVSPGNEVLISTKSNYGIVLQYRQATDDVYANYAYTNPTYLAGAAVGEFDISHDGAEGVVIGLEGRVVKVQYETDGYAVIPLRSELVVGQGRTDGFYFIVDALGTYNGAVDFELENTGGLTGAGIKAALSATSVQPLDLLFLNVTAGASTAKGTYAFSLKCSSSKPIDSVVLEKTLNLTVQVIGSGDPDIRLVPQTFYQDIVGDFHFTTRLDIISLGADSKVVGLDAWRLPQQTNVSLPGSITLSGTTSMNLTFTSSANTPVGRYIISISASLQDSSDEIIRHIPIVVDVASTGKGDFMLYIDRAVFEVHKNTTGNLTIGVASIFGFKDNVTMLVTGIPIGVDAVFVPQVLVPTSNTTLSITPSLAALEGDYDIVIHAVSGNADKQGVLVLRVLPPIPDFKLSFDLSFAQVIMKGKNVTMDRTLNITPLFNFSGWLALALETPMQWPQNASVTADMPEGVLVDGPTSVVVRVVITNLTATDFFNITVNATALDGTSRNATARVNVVVPDTPVDGTDINWTLVALIAVGILLALLGLGYVIKSRLDKNKPQDLDEDNNPDADGEGKVEDDIKQAKVKGRSAGTKTKTEHPKKKNGHKAKN